jgi:hypothetical protein
MELKIGQIWENHKGDLNIRIDSLTKDYALIYWFDKNTKFSGLQSIEIKYLINNLSKLVDKID